MGVRKIAGIALAPGVSKNGRLYTRENIDKMVTRAQGQIAAGGLPLTMLTHHGAEDDSTRIVGSVTGMTVDESGAAHFEATLADTEHARTIGQLVTGRHLRGVSIRGAWAGPVRTLNVGGQAVTTSSDLALNGLDFTARPGVDGATVRVAESVLAAGEIREEAPLVVPVTAGPTLADVAAMDAEAFDAAASDYFGARLAAVRGSFRPANADDVNRGAA